jgi:hypothetical protein
MGKVINGETTDVNVMYTSLLISYFIFCFGFKVFEEKKKSIAVVRPEKEKIPMKIDRP